MSPNTKRVAAHVINPITLTQLVLGKLAVTPLDVDRPKEPFEVEFVPIEGAYVLIREHGARTSLPRIGRTNSDGRVVERDEGDVHGPVDRVDVMPPQSMFLWEVDPLALPARDQMLLDTSTRHELFWCYDREHFERALTVLKSGNGTPVLEAHPLAFEELQATGLKDLDLLDDVLRRKVNLHLFGPREGCIAEPEHKRDLCFVDVTPTALRSLYRAEFMEWYGTKVLMKGMKHWNVLARIKNIADQAELGAPDVVLEARLKEGVPVGSRRRAVLEHYRDFVWECAQTSADVDDVRSLLDATTRDVNRSRHRRHLVESLSRRTPPALHPTLRFDSRDEDWLLTDASRLALEDYFDLYRFGIELNDDDLCVHLRTAMERVTEASSVTTDAIKDELARSCPLRSFSVAVDVHGTSDEDRVDLHKRHARICARSGFALWTAEDGYTKHEWTALEPYLKSLSNGGLLYGEIWKQALDKDLVAMNLRLDEMREVLDRKYRYHLASQQKTATAQFDEPLPKSKVSARIDLAAGTVEISGHPAMALEFTKCEQPVLHDNRLSRPRGYAQGRFTRAHLARREIVFDVELPFDLERARRLGADIPSVLAAAMNGLNLAVGLLAAHERLAEYDVQAWLDIGQNTLVAIDSTVALHAGMRLAHGQPISSVWTNLGKVLGGTVNVVDGLRNLAAGYELLFGDDAPVREELARGNSFRASVIQGKGVAQFTMGAAAITTGVGSLIVTAGVPATGVLAFATGPVGIAVAFCGLAIAGLDLALAATARFRDHTAMIEQAWKAARKDEVPDFAKEPKTAVRLRELSGLPNRCV